MAQSVEYLYSLGSFATKAIAALALQYYLVNTLSVDNFSSWSKIASLTVLATVSDLGVGQYVMTHAMQHDVNSTENRSIFLNSVALLSLLGLVIFGALAFAFREHGYVYSTALSLLVALRIALIPFGAILSAISRYHERKILEAICYVFSLLCIVAVGQKTPNFLYSLIILNAGFLICAVLVALRAAKFFRSEPTVLSLRWSKMLSIGIASLPYFINNVATLLIYGGFIWMMSHVLSPSELAKLAILHSLLFVNFLQVGEVIFRTKQAQLTSSVDYRKIELIIAIVGIIAVTTGLLLGPCALEFYTKYYVFSRLEIGACMLFMVIEVFWLQLHSRMQVQVSLGKNLAHSSLARAGAFALLLIGASVWTSRSLVHPLAALSLASLVIFFYYRSGALGKISMVTPTL